MKTQGNNMNLQYILKDIQRLRFVYGFKEVNELLADLDFYDQDFQEQARLLNVIETTLESEQKEGV